MGVYGEIARAAAGLASQAGLAPLDAWRSAVHARYPDPAMRRNALRHTCPKGAFLGLCQAGHVRGVGPGGAVRSVKSRQYALAALEKLRNNPALAADKTRLEAEVFGGRTPNDEVDVVLTLWREGLLT